MPFDNGRGAFMILIIDPHKLTLTAYRHHDRIANFNTVEDALSAIQTHDSKSVKLNNINSKIAELEAEKAKLEAQ